MRALLTLVLLAGACTGATPAPEPAQSVAPAPQSPARFRVSDPQSLLDFVPPTFADAPATARETTPDGDATGTWTPPGRSITLGLHRIDDVRATRAGFELLGRDAEARMNGQEVRGLRVQGNPAQVSRALSEPHAGTLHVVAANTYLVTFTVTPSLDLDEVVQLSEGLDIGGLTRLALREHKQKAAPTE